MESRALNRPCHHPMPPCCAQHLSSPHTVQGPMGHAARRPTCDSAWPQPLWPPVVKVRNHSLRYRNGRRHHGGYLLALSVRITAFSASNLAGCGPRASWCGCMHRPAAMSRGSCSQLRMCADGIEGIEPTLPSSDAVVPRATPHEPSHSEGPYGPSCLEAEMRQRMAPALLAPIGECWNLLAEVSQWSHAPWQLSACPRSANHSVLRQQSGRVWASCELVRVHASASTHAPRLVQPAEYLCRWNRGH